MTIKKLTQQEQDYRTYKTYKIWQEMIKKENSRHKVWLEKLLNKYGWTKYKNNIL